MSKVVEVYVKSQESPVQFDFSSFSTIMLPIEDGHIKKKNLQENSLRLRASSEEMLKDF